MLNVLKAEETEKFSTDINSPEVTGCNNVFKTVITLPSVRTWPSDPVKSIHNECWVYIQLLMPLMSPFSNTIRAVFPPPFYASTCKDWVVSLEFLKWATGFGKNVGITGKEPGYSFTRAVRGRFNMKRSSMFLFMAVESQLSERYAGSQFSHTVRRENHSVAVVTTDSCICLFNIQIGGGHSSPSNNVID